MSTMERRTGRSESQSIGNNCEELCWMDWNVLTLREAQPGWPEN